MWCYLSLLSESWSNSYKTSGKRRRRPQRRRKSLQRVPKCKIWRILLQRTSTWYVKRLQADFEQPGQTSAITYISSPPRTDCERGVYPRYGNALFVDLDPKSAFGQRWRISCCSFGTDWLNSYQYSVDILTGLGARKKKTVFPFVACGVCA